MAVKLGFWESVEPVPSDHVSAGGRGLTEKLIPLPPEYRDWLAVPDCQL
jgi:hypothetical protein